MTNDQLIHKLFTTIKNLRVKTFGVTEQDAVSEVQEFERQCCREWCSEEHEWVWVSSTKHCQLLRANLRDLKQWIKDNPADVEVGSPSGVEVTSASTLKLRANL